MVIHTLKYALERWSGVRKFGSAPKIFCVGRNKTGTTSLKVGLKDLGFSIGRQRIAELLYDKHYFNENYAPIIKYCRAYQAFQDVPFSCPGTFQHLDKAFAGSKFILTVRDSSEQWYNSLTRFQSQLFGDGKLPSFDQLSQAEYVRKGYATNIVKLYGTSRELPYEKSKLISHYEAHNADVINYFSERKQDLLVLNIGQNGSYEALLDFLNVKSNRTEFPWENKS